jgi:hypothetical protein
MKRSGPLRRKTPLTPGGPLKRTRLKPESAKHRKRRMEAKPFRKNYLSLHPQCAVFPSAPSIEVHEITAGPDREVALDIPAAVLAVSRPGHLIVQHEHIFRQCARKLLATPDEFDLKEINRLVAPKDCENPPEYVTLADLVPHLVLKT